MRTMLTKRLKITAIILVYFLFALNSHAQNLYSVENLNKSTNEELSRYLDKARKLKTTGLILTIAAPVSAVAGLALSGRESNFTAAFSLLLGSAGLIAVGVPVLTIGHARVARVSNVWNEKHKGVSFRLAPSTQYNYLTQNCQPGLALKINF